MKIILVLFFVIFVLFACGKQSDVNNSTVYINNTNVPELQSIYVDVSAELTIAGKTCILNLDAKASIKGVCSDIPLGTHTYSIEYRHRQTNILLANAVGKMTFVAGKEFSISMEAVSLAFDNDNDDFSNIQEVLNGSNPQDRNSKPRLIASIVVNQISSDIQAGESVQGSWNITDDRGTAFNSAILFWESSDSEIARVDNKGIITAVKSGTVTITAKDPFSTKFHSIVVTVASSSTQVPNILVRNTVQPFDDNQASFGYVTIGNSSETTITISNDGTADLILGTIGHINSLAEPFHIRSDTCSQQTLAPNESCSLTIRFEPSVAGSYNDGFNITSNDPEESSITFSVVGNGSEIPTPNILVRDVEPPFDDKRISFGYVSLSKSSKSTITIFNNGSADLMIGTIGDTNSLIAPFHIGTDACSGKTLAPSASCNLTIRFEPSSEGLFNETFDIGSNDPDEDSLTFIVSGTGTEMPMPNIIVRDVIPPIDDRQVSFGIVSLGNSQETTITINNNGSADLIVGTIGSTDSLASPFRIGRDECSQQTLAPNENCSLTIQFEPSVAGSFDDTFSIASNDPENEALTFSVAGTGYPTFTIAGNVTGLTGQTLKLQNDETTEELTITGNGPFEFPTKLFNGSIYEVTVALDPLDPTQTCLVNNGYGTVNNADVTKIIVHCTTGVWEPINNGLFGGDVNVLIKDPNSPSILYAGLASGGVYKSTDEGDSWRAINNGISNLYIQSLDIDPKTTTTIYAGSRRGVFKSIDGGANWITVNDSIFNVNTITVHPQVPDTIYAGTDNYLYKSVDGGLNWDPTGLPYNQVKVLKIDRVNPSIIYVGTKNLPASARGIYKSTDDGENWSTINQGLTNLEINSLAIDPQNSSILYTGTRDGVYKSVNGGTNWKLASSSIYAANYISISTENSLHVYAGSYRSTDGGANWSYFSVVSIEIKGIVPNFVDTSKIIAATKSGIYKTNDNAENWSDSSTGLAAVSVEVLAINPDTPNVIYAGTKGKGMFKSSDAGVSWQLVSDISNLNSIDAIVIDPKSTSTVYVASRSVYKSTDSGESWNYSNTGIAGSTFSMAIDPVNTSTLFTGALDGFYKSDNGGSNWSKMSNSFASGTWLNSIGINPQTPSILYLGTDRDNTYIYKSIDGGASWIASDTGYNSYGVNSILVDPQTPTTIYAASSYDILKSFDSGANWNTVNVGKDKVGAIELKFDPQNPTTIFAATYNGFYKSIDGGSNWGPINKGLADVFIQTIAVAPSKLSIMYIGTNGNGVYRWKSGNN